MTNEVQLILTMNALSYLILVTSYRRLCHARVQIRFRQAPNSRNAETLVSFSTPPKTAPTPPSHIQASTQFTAQQQGGQHHRPGP
ncbi:uncharacterized protein K452DRAFT_36881 [Aplosporella prunicola CBS 121167]|uniref:Uncharacterized protein n=1 Tax=Aplosporella prunicola CBS 121167 TaxID=1176127 RepID=A0A6A6BAW0_9PEZI|nr:uncharacterized protein K452DRAFT_36881 [Aplosporella prunicola CBS 121167]KAF2141230.1 hypothetical protein K452DRAFT_36881 [Aplosporella prunicola CBS 121167]